MHSPTHEHEIDMDQAIPEIQLRLRKVAPAAKRIGVYVLFLVCLAGATLGSKPAEQAMIESLIEDHKATVISHSQVPVKTQG